VIAPAAGVVTPRAILFCPDEPGPRCGAGRSPCQFCEGGLVVRDVDLPPELLNELGDGRPAAYDALFARYARRLARLAERHLSRRVAARADGEDVVQSAFRTFVRRHRRDEFRIHSSGELWRLLARITWRKALTQARRHTAGPRDVGAEAADGAGQLAAALSREPDPGAALLLGETIERLLHGLPEWYGRLLELRLANHSVAEIAPRLNISRQTAYRALDLLGDRLGAPPGRRGRDRSRETV
jgi:DNA-directed RNA polymerase specialized sigma24 family protein